jgi:hypothetical protein
MTSFFPPAGSRRILVEGMWQSPDGPMPIARPFPCDYT